MSSIANGSAPTNRSRNASNAPSTASAQPSRLASPQPTAPSSISTRTNSQRGGAKNVSIRPILRLLTGEPRFVDRESGVVVLGMLAQLLDRHDQAYALRRQDIAPVGDQLLVSLADVADLAVEIEQAERIDVAVLLAERGVPVDLVGQAVPGEADGRDADVPEAQDVGPFLPQPFDRLVAVRALPQIGFGVHHRQAVAVVILPRDLGITERLARSDGVAVGEHAMFVQLVIVVAENAVLLE